LPRINAWIVIISMSDFDWSDLDARLLRLLVAVVETGSITAAANRLGVTQSAVSHLVHKLRAIVGDALFVKAGRGIVATARAEALAKKARDILRDLERFAASDAFDPARWRTTFAIAANDLQRDALLPALLARLRERAPGVVLRVIPSNVPTPEMLREERCHLIVSPRPPEAADIMQKRLFEDSYRVFFDPARRAPRTRPNTSPPTMSRSSMSRGARSISTRSSWPGGSRGASSSRSPASPACQPSCAAGSSLRPRRGCSASGSFRVSPARRRRSPAPACRCS
jgi:DNA-binding transcriptional LysR family regulator